MSVSGRFRTAQPIAKFFSAPGYSGVSERDCTSIIRKAYNLSRERIQGKNMIDSFAFTGFRSFGKEPQFFDQLTKVNVIIGRNNCGKSNVLRFIHSVYSQGSSKPIRFDQLDTHIPSAAAFMVGHPIKLERTTAGTYEIADKKAIASIFRKTMQPVHLEALAKVLKTKADLDKTVHPWFFVDPAFSPVARNWPEAFGAIGDRELKSLWIAMSDYGDGGSRDGDWYPLVLSKLKPSLPAIKTVMIPAIRQIQPQSGSEDSYGGIGIIEKLARLQNPDVHNQAKRKKFEAINEFLRNVTENSTARIEIPYERNTILVHMDEKTLPLESLGSGIHEVIILAAASTVLEKTVICMEEPELHLNPILQKKLIRYLHTSTDNQYFISTHSASFIDTPDVEVYHIEIKDGCSIATRVSSNKQRTAICEDLGYHPSDLLQANCVLWVEGPSDRLYLNYWLKEIAPDFMEGIHYSVMFYGGRLAAHVSNEDIDTLVDSFISLRRLNQRGFILIDSDKPNSAAKLNSTKQRLRKEFDDGPGFAWITKGREVENYIPAEYIKNAIPRTKPSCTLLSGFQQYENTLKIKLKNGKEAQASKVEVAKYITANCPVDLNQLDLKAQLQRVVEFIKKSNPSR
jgi:predicted ATPase